MALGYLLVRSKIKDVERYQRFRGVIYRLAQSYGAHALIRTAEVEVLHGPDEGLLLVVLEFPSIQAVKLFTSSAEYAQLRDDRVEAGVIDIWVAPGI